MTFPSIYMELQDAVCALEIYARADGLPMGSQWEKRQVRYQLNEQRRYITELIAALEKRDQGGEMPFVKKPVWKVVE